MADEDPYFLMVGIDFGTTFSGYAFQITSSYKSDDPTAGIFCPQAWNCDQTRLTSLKTPTCLLLDRNTDIDSFGYQAEDRYADLCLDGDHFQYYFFRRFKMELHDKKTITKADKLKDETGKELKALTVFARSIEALKSHLFKMLRERKIDPDTIRIKWVLTVPAIWDDTAKHFMREAAVEAGIASKDLSIALEPEAASLYCQYLPVEKKGEGAETRFTDAKPGTTYMILDLGGGTADITVHEKISKGRLKEVDRASGGPWGGTAVDGAFIRLISEIVGGPVFAKFMMEYKYDYLDLMRDVEAMKRNINASSEDPVKIKFPASLNEICQKMVKKGFGDLVKEARKDKQISFVGDKMKINPDLVRSLFRKTADKILSHMKKIIEHSPVGKKISLILMVGGLSESPYIQDLVRAEYHNKGGRTVLVPRDAGLSVLKGAVVYGRQPENITSRVLRYNYGVQIAPEFDDKIHKPSKKFKNKDGQDRCDDIFSCFINAGTDVKQGHVVNKIYYTTVSFQEQVALKIFFSDADDTEYTDDDGCRYLGKLTVDIPNPSAEERHVLVQYTFGDTELHISAIEEDNQEPCNITMKMLE